MQFLMQTYAGKQAASTQDMAVCPVLVDNMATQPFVGRQLIVSDSAIGISQHNV